jgi:hypothetical protein
MELLQDKIKYTLDRVKNLKAQETELVKDINDAFKGFHTLPQLKKALLYAVEKNPKHNWSEYTWIQLHHSWMSEDPIYHHNFKFHERMGITPATYVFELKDIKYFCTQEDVYLKWGHDAQSDTLRKHYFTS